MPKNWRRDQIQETYTQEEWNEMYSKAEAGEPDEVTKEWNKFYDTVTYADDPDIIEWNKIANNIPTEEEATE